MGESTEAGAVPVERIQTGVRMEKRVLKVLKALAEYKDQLAGRGVAQPALLRRGRHIGSANAGDEPD